MRITESADWRDALPFESPVVLADVVPGEPARCAGCGPDVDPRPRTELWAYKHRHPNNHAGFVRFYCVTHVPAARRPAPSPAVTTRSRPERAPRQALVRRPAQPERQAVLCPNCFVEVPPTGVCGICGEKVG
ncbi:glucose-6-phosphate dehydrogenase [Microbacterium sp. B2969]|uniref:Glucose-6-phosphate dehydrogenase n=1 Tax=Microbacterium alkaliflavum TaxID=3248839 RepID=A0ABW7Q2N1_9MICO